MAIGLALLPGRTPGAPCPADAVIRAYGFPEPQSVAFQPRAGRLAISFEGGVAVANKDTGEVQALLNYRGEPSGLAWSPTTDRLVTAESTEAAEGAPTIREATTLRRLLTLAMPPGVGTISAFVWGQNGDTIVGSALQKLLVWDASTGDVIQVVSVSYLIRGLKLSPQGNRVLVFGDQETIEIFDLARRAFSLSVELTHAAEDVAWSPDATVFALVAERRLQIFSALTGRHLVDFERANTQLTSVAWSHHDSRIATGSSNRGLILWDVIDGSSRTFFEEESVRSIAWIEDDSQIALASPRGVRIVSSQDGSELRLFLAQPAYPAWATWSPSSDQVAYPVEEDGNEYIEVRNAITGAVQTRWPSDVGARLTRMLWSPDGSKMAVLTDGAQSIVHVWEVATGQSLWTHLAASRNYGFAWAPDSSRIAMSSQQSNIGFYDAQTGVLTTSMPNSRSWMLAWSADGLRLASESTLAESEVTSVPSIQIKIWNVEHGEVMRRIEIPTQLNDMQWSPDGQFLATASEDVQVVDLDGHLRARLPIDQFGPTEVTSVSWSPDSQYVLGSFRATGFTSSRGGGALIWRLSDFQRVWSHDPFRPVAVSAWSSDGCHFLSGGPSLRVWSTEEALHPSTANPDGGADGGGGVDPPDGGRPTETEQMSPGPSDSNATARRETLGCGCSANPSGWPLIAVPAIWALSRRGRRKGDA